MKNLSPVIKVEELILLKDNDQIILIDASNGKNAKENYKQKHLNQALFVDLDSQLSGDKTNPANGGRHPLPSILEFSKTLQQLGISKKSHVVIYDSNNGSNAAARFWWMLKSIGHKKVQVLDGGFQEAERNDYPINDSLVFPKQVSEFTVEKWILPLAEIAEVERKSQTENNLIIDVRAENRYRGEFEPIDPIAGHIPGAINIPFESNLTADGLFLSKDELRKKYQKVFDQTPIENIIVHCGSGVTACHTLLAMDYAGFPIPKLYIGSWSEWCRTKKPL